MNISETLYWIIAKNIESNKTMRMIVRKEDKLVVGRDSCNQLYFYIEKDRLNIVSNYASA